MLQHPLPPQTPAAASDGDVVPSTDGMTATTLRDKVRAELIAQDMTWSALQKRAQVSQKTIDKLKNGDDAHTWQHTTLSKVDAALGLTPGTLYAIWDDSATAPASAVAEIAAQMRLLEVKVSEYAERPPWMAEAVEVLAALDPDERYLVIAVARRLARR